MRRCGGYLSQLVQFYELECLRLELSSSNSPQMVEVLHKPISSHHPLFLKEITIIIINGFSLKLLQSEEAKDYYPQYSA